MAQMGGANRLGHRRRGHGCHTHAPRAGKLGWIQGHTHRHGRPWCGSSGRLHRQRRQARKAPARGRDDTKRDGHEQAFLRRRTVQKRGRRLLLGRRRWQLPGRCLSWPRGAEIVPMLYRHFKYCIKYLTRTCNKARGLRAETVLERVGTAARIDSRVENVPRSRVPSDVWFAGGNFHP